MVYYNREEFLKVYPGCEDYADLIERHLGATHGDEYFAAVYINGATGEPYNLRVQCTRADCNCIGSFDRAIGPEPQYVAGLSLWPEGEESILDIIIPDTCGVWLYDKRERLRKVWKTDNYYNAVRVAWETGYGDPQPWWGQSRERNDWYACIAFIVDESAPETFEVDQAHVDAFPHLRDTLMAALQTQPYHWPLALALRLITPEQAEEYKHRLSQRAQGWEAEAVDTFFLKRKPRIIPPRKRR